MRCPKRSKYRDCSLSQERLDFDPQCGTRTSNSRTFKGVQQARLDLAPSGSSARVHTLVGLNESGKTTILEAIDFFRGAGEDEIRPKQLGGLKPLDHQSVIPIAERANFNERVNIRCGIELDDADVEAVREHLAQIDGYRLIGPRARASNHRLLPIQR